MVSWSFPDWRRRRMINDHARLEKKRISGASDTAKEINLVEVQSDPLVETAHRVEGLASHGEIRPDRRLIGPIRSRLVSRVRRCVERGIQRSDTIARTVGEDIDDGPTEDVSLATVARRSQLTEPTGSGNCIVVEVRKPGSARESSGLVTSDAQATSRFVGIASEREGRHHIPDTASRAVVRHHDLGIGIQLRCKCSETSVEFEGPIQRADENRYSRHQPGP
jgi:hypothetical protein